MALSHLDNLVKSIPYLHPKVNITSLDNKGKLISEKEIKNIKEKLRKKDNIVIKYKEFTVLKASGKCYITPNNDTFLLGKGSYGEVRLAQDIDTGEWIALKKIFPKTFSEKDEVEALRKNNSLEFYLPDKSKKRSNRYLGMKLLPGIDLNLFLKNTQRKIPPVRWLDMSISMLASLNAIHTQSKLLHRDIKPENMVYDSATHQVKLTDLGLSVPISKGKNIGFAGSLDYMPPEIEDAYNQYTKKQSKGDCDFSEKTDVYSMGMSMAEVLGLAANVEEIIDERPEVILKIISETSSAFKANQKIPDEKTRLEILNFIKKMTHKDATKRPSVTDAMTFFNKIRSTYLNIDILNKIIYLDIETFQKASSQEKKLILAELKKMDEVWLVDTQKMASTHYSAIQRMLEDNGILVGREVIQATKGNERQQVQKYLQQRERQDENIYICSSITKTGNVNFPDIVSNTHFNRIKAVLLDEINRLKSTPFSGNIALISDALQKLEGLHLKGILTYDNVEDDLNILQQKFSSSKEVQEVISNILTEMEKMQVIRPKKIEEKKVTKEVVEGKITEVKSTLFKPPPIATTSPKIQSPVFSNCKPIPYKHPNIDEKLLKSNGKLLEDSEIKKIKDQFSKNENMVSHFSDAGFQIIKFGENYYVISRNKAHNLILNDNKNGATFLAQNLTRLSR